jgi:glycosyltransferase involved in cell wall biosynthesis
MTVPIRVLFLHAGEDWVRGSETALLALLRGLDRREIAPLLLTSNRELARLASADGVETILHAMPRIMVDGIQIQVQLWLWSKTVARALSVIRGRRIDVVYCNGGSTCQVGLYAGKLGRVPVIAHLHSPYDRRHILLYRFHRASHVIFVSQAIEKSIRGKQNFQARCDVVHNGIDTERFVPAQERHGFWREKLGIPPEAVVFGQVSSLIARKGVDILLRALQVVSRKHPAARLILVGDGPQREELVRMATGLGIDDKITWTGNQADTVPFYQHVFDVNVLASRSDAFPLSVLEASACGLPNLAANVDGIPESVFDRQTGLLFEADNHGQLAEEMATLMDSPDLRRELGQAGRKVAAERFSIQDYCRSIESIIRQQAQGLGAAFSERRYALKGSSAL